MHRLGWQREQIFSIKAGCKVKVKHCFECGVTKMGDLIKYNWYMGIR